MTEAEKLSKVKTILKLTDTSLDTEIVVYLSLVKAEILSWMYSGDTPDEVTEVPEKYETTQIMSVIAGINTQGAEGQTGHSENGISRTWKYEDMVSYVRSHVYPYVVVI